MRDFTDRGLNHAWLAQCRNTRRGDSNCAACGKSIYWHCRGDDVEGGWKAVKRSEKENYTMENCVLLCLNCFKRSQK